MYPIDEGIKTCEVALKRDFTNYEADKVKLENTKHQMKTARMKEIRRGVYQAWDTFDTTGSGLLTMMKIKQLAFELMTLEKLVEEGSKHLLKVDPICDLPFNQYFDTYEKVSMDNTQTVEFIFNLL